MALWLTVARARRTIRVCPEMRHRTAKRRAASRRSSRRRIVAGDCLPGAARCCRRGVEARGEPFRRCVGRGAAKSRCSGHPAVETLRAADPSHSRVRRPRVLLGHGDAELVKGLSDDSSQGRCRSRFVAEVRNALGLVPMAPQGDESEVLSSEPSGPVPCRQVRRALPEDLVGPVRTFASILRWSPGPWRG
jgi:hypothetical protein